MNINIHILKQCICLKIEVKIKLIFCQHSLEKKFRVGVVVHEKKISDEVEILHGEDLKT